MRRCRCGGGSGVARNVEEGGWERNDKNRATGGCKSGRQHVSVRVVRIRVDREDGRLRIGVQTVGVVANLVPAETRDVVPLAGFRWGPRRHHVSLCRPPGPKTGANAGGKKLGETASTQRRAKESASFRRSAPRAAAATKVAMGL